MIEEIKGVTVLELSELVHALEEEFGVSAAAMAAQMCIRDRGHGGGVPRRGQRGPCPHLRPKAAHGSGPVSYTHLDVYKRQSSRSAVFSGFLSRSYTVPSFGYDLWMAYSTTFRKKCL